MIKVELSEVEYSIIRSALTHEYYNARDEGEDHRQKAIITLETKLSEIYAKLSKEDE